MVARSAGYDSFREDHFSMVSTKRTIADLILISLISYLSSPEVDYVRFIFLCAVDSTLKFDAIIR